MDVLGYIYDAQGLFSLFGRRLLELGSPGDMYSMQAMYYD